MNGRRTALAIAVLVVMVTGAAAIAGAAGPAKNGRIAFVRFGLGTGVQSSEIFVTNADGTGEQRLTPGSRRLQGRPSQLGTRRLPDRVPAMRCRRRRVSRLVGEPGRVGSGAPEPAVSGGSSSTGVCRRPEPGLLAGRKAHRLRSHERQAGRDAGGCEAGASPHRRRPRVVPREPVRSRVVAEREATRLCERQRQRQRAPSTAVSSTDGKRDGVRRLTPWALEAGGRPDWSPDGKRILFHSYSNRLGGVGVNLYTVRPDGTGLTQVTHVR